jgi:uncharacterized membrane protein YeaQ/YmgE (transglycosylase-associated protein family)
LSVFVWVMIGVAVWHACILVPDRFYGGIIGAFLAAVTGALVTGYLLPAPGIPPTTRRASRRRCGLYLGR